ncbi:Protein of unknown function DUF484 [Candidatus Burkholderia brachyanthoides]|nr:Protein of unknown function DUF484 [Candidatus Burkholderia brachyanthoides]
MNAREVADYLLDNPDFFAEHAELIGTIRLSNPHGKAAMSLQKRQMEMLRYGHENDSISAKFNRWTVRVAAQRDLYTLPATVSKGLCEVFDVPHAALRVWDVDEAYRQADFSRQVGEEVRIFATSLDAPYCGANTGFAAAQWLEEANSASATTTDGAGDELRKIESVALIGLRDPQAGPDAPVFGLLVMGSPDPHRFDFLTQIGALASAALSRLLPH